MFTPSNHKLTLSQKIKLNLILPYLDKKQKIIDLGCGNMWLTTFLREKGYHCVGFADKKPADIIGDVKTYPFKKNQYDVVIALEMIEHVNCFVEIETMLKPEGILIISSPVPHFDWLCRVLERLHIFQDRETPHCNLFYLKDVPFKPVRKIVLFGINQFGVFTNNHA